jgi:putative aldouronate transport system permease protein
MSRLSKLQFITNKVYIPKKQGFPRYLANYYEYYLMLIPAIAFYFIFKYFPMYGILMAFKDYNFMIGVFKSPWVGFSVFKEVFREAAFWQALFNTLWLNVLCLAVQFPFPIIFALLLNELINKRFKKIVQTISYMPHFVSWIIVYGLMLALVDKGSGLINVFISKMGIESIDFLIHKGWWLFLFVFAGTWKEMGWSAIIYLAALSSIDSALYEAAEIDGANRFKKIWHVTIPGIKGTIIILLILNIGSLVNIGFEQPYLFGNAMVSDISSVLSTFIYDRGIVRAQFSYTTAVGLFQQVVNFILLLMANRTIKLLGEEGLFGGAIK